VPPFKLLTAMNSENHPKKKQREFSRVPKMITERNRDEEK
jgi:hypothetical protein